MPLSQGINLQMDWATASVIVTTVIAIYGLVMKIVLKKKLENSNGNNGKSSQIESSVILSNTIKKEIKEELDKIKTEMRSRDHVRTLSGIDSAEKDIGYLKEEFKSIEHKVDLLSEADKDIREIQVRIENLEMSLESTPIMFQKLFDKIDKINDFLIDELKTKSLQGKKHGS